MSERCTAIQGNRVRCSSMSYDRSGECEQHSGINQREWRINRRVIEHAHGERIIASVLRPPPVDKVLVCPRKDADCLVCLDKVSEYCILPCCKQTCCYDCLHGWLNTKNKTCPHCRKNLENYAVTSAIIR